ncbi:MAG TPA: four helix bundle protein [Vicinamibacterales bacterium]
MSSESEALKERTMSFAVGILQLIETFPKTIGGRIVAGQLADAATSVGSNYRAVCTARSDREFVAKLCIVHEEADESVYWLEIALRCNYSTPVSIRAHLSEAIQLRAIFGRSLKTVRLRLSKPQPNARIAKRPNGQITQQPNGQITQQPNDQIIKQPNDEMTK